MIHANGQLIISGFFLPEHEEQLAYDSGFLLPEHEDKANIKSQTFDHTGEEFPTSSFSTCCLSQLTLDTTPMTEGQA